MRAIGPLPNSAASSHTGPWPIISGAALAVKPPADKFPDGTTVEDRLCWVCGGETSYRNCKIICKNCGFTRDCSDP